MQAIQVKYLSATEIKGVRLKAAAGNSTLTVSRDYSQEFESQALELAHELAKKLEWKVEKFAAGSFKNSYYFNIVS